jgi:hypothetical protein
MAHVPHEWKGVGSVPTPRGAQSALVLTEPGLNFFLSRSDKECAISAFPPLLKFQHRHRSAPLCTFFNFSKFFDRVRGCVRPVYVCVRRPVGMA